MPQTHQEIAKDIVVAAIAHSHVLQPSTNGSAETFDAAATGNLLAAMYLRVLVAVVDADAGQPLSRQPNTWFACSSPWSESR